MKRLGAMILVLALALAMFPMTAMAAEAAKTSFSVIGMKTTTRTIESVPDTSMPTSDIFAQVAFANTWAGTNGFTSVLAIVVTGQTIDINGALSDTDFNGVTVIFDNTYVNIGNGGKLDLSTKSYFVGSSSGVTVTGTGEFHYSKYRIVVNRTFNTDPVNIKTDPSGTFIAKPQDSTALDLTAGAAVSTYDRVDGITKAQISYDITLDGNIEIPARFVGNYKDRITVKGNVNVSTAGEEFGLTDGSSLTNNGTIYGAGILRTGDPLAGMTPSIINNGTISTSIFRVKSDGAFTNGPQGIVNSTNFDIQSNATVTNNGRVSAGSTTIASGATLNNNGTFAAGILNNLGIINDLSRGFTYISGNLGIFYQPNYNYNNYYAPPVGPSITHVSGGVFTTTGMYNQFQSLSANGVQLTRGTDYTIENVGGYARILVNDSVMNGLSGNAKFTAVFTNGAASATVLLSYTYVPDDIILDPPKTGDANSLMGFGIVFIALALAVIARKARASAK